MEARKVCYWLGVTFLAIGTVLMGTALFWRNDWRGMSWRPGFILRLEQPARTRGQVGLGLIILGSALVWRLHDA